KLSFLNEVHETRCHNESSIFFNFVEETFSSIDFMQGIVELPNSNRAIKKFLKKHDQLLLEIWGKEEFAERLQPLDISLKEWLKAV
ncbi:hypothetical protein QUF54_07505, partial [Candidatus Marithioploca araucensis]|nr:hypothetical protein [Candidatus Marithioploca araucensis]